MPIKGAKKTERISTRGAISRRVKIRSRIRLESELDFAIGRQIERVFTPLRKRKCRFTRDRVSPRAGVYLQCVYGTEIQRLHNKETTIAVEYVYIHSRMLALSRYKCELYMCIYIVVCLARVEIV